MRPTLGTAEVQRRLVEAAAAGADGVVFSGGEPTLRDDLGQLLRAAAAQGLAAGLVTNARRMAYGPFAELVLAGGLRYALVSLHASDPGVHDRLVRVPGAHRQTMAGVEALAGRLDVLVVNTVVVRDNLTQLRPLVDRLHRLPGVRLKLSLVEPKGAARADDPELLPDLEVAGRAVLDAVVRAEELGLPIGYDGFPRCVPGAFATYDEHLERHGIRWMRESDEARLFPVDRGARTWPAEPCDRCRLRATCPGLYAAWPAARGGRALAPFRGLVPNSILLPARRASGAAPDPEDLEVVTPGQRLLARVRSRDFTAAEVRDAVVHRRQVYLASPGCRGAPLDRALLPLRRERRGAYGRFVPARRDPFAVELQRIERFLRGRSGRLLDVGCGAPRYRDLLERQVRRGRLRYLGVDPDPTVRRAFRDTPAGLDLVVGAVEDLRLPVATVDTVLALRCYNHLADPMPALLLLARALVDGGVLWLADDQPFAVVRRGRPRRGGGRYEHHRNAGPDEVLAALAPLPFTLVERRDAGPGTAPSWTLVLRRTDRRAPTG